MPETAVRGDQYYDRQEAVDDDPMQQLLAHSITYRIAVGPQAGRKASRCKPCRPVM